MNKIIVVFWCLSSKEKICGTFSDVSGSASINQALISSSCVHVKPQVGTLPARLCSWQLYHTKREKEIEGRWSGRRGLGAAGVRCY